MLFSEVERGQLFTFGLYIYMKTELVVDYDNANRKYNAVIFKSDTGTKEGYFVFIDDFEECTIVDKDKLCSLTQ